MSLLIPWNLTSPEKLDKLCIQESSGRWIQSQLCITQCRVPQSRAKATLNSFYIQMRKSPIHTERDREIKRSGRCWHVYRQQQRVLVSTWERVNDTPLRSVGGTQVSGSTLPQGQWWSDADETRQRCINLSCATEAAVTIALPTYTCITSASGQTPVDTPGDSTTGLAQCESLVEVWDAVPHKAREQQERQTRVI